MSDDLISRQAVFELIEHYNSDGLGSVFVDFRHGIKFADAINALPSVTPTERTGHWIEKDGFDGDVYYDCSECGESWTTIEGTPWDNVWNYCPSCGARMFEPQKSDIEKRKPCVNYEDGCEEWAGCPCVYYKAESEEISDTNLKMWQEIFKAEREG